MSSVTMTRGAGVHHLPKNFQLQHGGVLPLAQLGFELFGREGAPVVIVQGGISAGRHVACHASDSRPGWWDAVVGPGRAVDTTRFRVLGVDYLGGAGISTGPGAHDIDFPAVTSTDQARALALLLDHLGIRRVHCFVGASYGGMVGLAFAADYPETLGSLVAISAAHESHPLATGWRWLQRQIVRQGVETGDPSRALTLARGLAMTTYRTAEEFAERFRAAPELVDGEPKFGVADYLTARGEAFASEFPPATFLTLSQAIDLHCVDPLRVKVPTVLVGVDSDQLVPEWQLSDLARSLPGGELLTIRSVYGHDAFLKEVGALTPILQTALLEEVAA